MAQALTNEQKRIKSVKRMAVVSTLLTFLLVAIIVVMSIYIFNKNKTIDELTQKLATTKEILGQTTLTEGRIEGSFITASLDWIYFSNDGSYLDSTSEEKGKPLSNLFIELHSAGKLKAFKDNLLTLEFNDKIVVSNTSSEKLFFSVNLPSGSYIIAQPVK